MICDCFSNDYYSRNNFQRFIKDKKENIQFLINSKMKIENNCIKNLINNSKKNERKSSLKIKKEEDLSNLLKNIKSINYDNENNQSLIKLNDKNFNKNTFQNYQENSKKKF